MADLDIEVDATKGYIFAMFFCEFANQHGAVVGGRTSRKIGEMGQSGNFSLRNF